jgi:hypothetical protein
MTHSMTPHETAQYMRSQHLTRIRACSSFLKTLDKGARPTDASLDEVRQATVTACEQLAATDNNVESLSQTDCPCVLLGADRCLREGDR